MDFLNYVHIIKMCFFSFDLQKSCKYINRANRACLEVGICFARIFAIFHFFLSQFPDPGRFDAF